MFYVKLIAEAKNKKVEKKNEKKLKKKKVCGIGDKTFFLWVRKLTEALFK